MARTGILAIVGVVGIAAGLGCATIDPWSVRRDLEETQRRYTQMLRWGEFARASQFVDPEMREAFLAELDAFSDVRLSEYEVLRVDLADDMTKAEADVAYRGYHVSHLTERRFRETQQWYRDPLSGSWRVRPDLENLRSGLAKIAQ